MAINTEKLYDLACDNVKQLLLSDGEKFEELDHAFSILTKEENIKGVMNMNPRLAPALEIYLAAKDELGKAKGGTAYSAFKRVIKRNGDIRKNLCGVWTDGEGRSCVCDGYIAIRMRSPVEGFENVPGVDLDKLWVKDSDLVTEINVPTPGEVKINKKKLANGKAVYDFGDELPMVDVKLLKDVMDCLPDAKAYITGRGTASPIIFKSDRGDALLLPVRKNVA